MISKIGEVSLFWGGMFTGKTTLLIKTLIKAGTGAICFKPSVDTRADDGVVRTHDGDEFPATAVEEASQILFLLDSEITTIGIEEASLFGSDPTLIPTIVTLRDMGYNVVISGLDRDRYDQPFGQMAEIASLADGCIKLRTKCHECDEWASLPYYNGEKQKDLVVVGGSELYTPLCRTCFELKQR